MGCNEYGVVLSSFSPPVCPYHECTCVWCAHIAQITSGGEVLSSARLRDPQARCPLVAIFFCRPHPMVRNTSALPRGASIKANITQHSALRPADGHITNINVLRVVGGLVVGPTNTSCCGVCSAQPHRKCGEGWPLPLQQAKR